MACSIRMSQDLAMPDRCMDLSLSAVTLFMAVSVKESHLESIGLHEDLPAVHQTTASMLSSL